MSTDYLFDGILDASSGMNAGQLSQLLSPDELAYILNGDVGAGFIKNRPCVNKVGIIAPNQGTIDAATHGYFYGGTVYTSDQGVTCIACSIGGMLYRFTPQYDFNGNAENAVLVDNQSAVSGLAQDDTTSTQHWLIQAERWVIWNDGINLPLFWDGSANPPALRRSVGNAVPSYPYPVVNEKFPELPAGKQLAYGQGQVWEALVDGYSFLFSDPVNFSSGTVQYGFRDSVLKLKMNSSYSAGGNFRVPTPTGAITGLTFTALLDATLGTGPLQVFAESAVYGCIAPITSQMLATLTNPLLTASLEGSGGAGESSNVSVNGDIFFRSLDGQIRSLYMARRDFLRWGNTPVSFEVNPYIIGDAQNLLPNGSAVVFDNNVLMTVNPVQGEFGIYYQNIVSLSLEQISGIKEKTDPAYNGLWNIGNVLGLFVGTFNNVRRCYAFVFNTGANVIELYELLPGSSPQYLDSNQNPINMQCISRALFWKSKGKTEFDLIKLEGGEMAAQEIEGVVKFTVEYKSVYDPNWHPWYSWRVDNTGGQNGYQPRMGLGRPQTVPNPATGRPCAIDYAFQVRITILGSCRFMGLRIAASVQPQPELAPPFPLS